MSSLFLDEEAESPTEENRLTDARNKLILLTRFWTAVRTNFPAAWQDRTNFVLLQAIGLNAFSRLAAVVIDELVESRKVHQKDFDLVLKHISTKVDLSRDAWQGFAGLAGAKQVFNKLYSSRLEGFNKTVILEDLQGPETSLLDE